MLYNDETKQIILSVVIATLLAVRGYRHKSLSLDGAISGWFVGFLSMLASQRFGFLLIAFFVTSSFLTKRGAKMKQKLEAGYKEGGRRNYVQVLANGGFGTLLACLYLWHFGIAPDHVVDFSKDAYASFLATAYLGHYACTNGDTWSSEIGILSRQKPRLITTFQIVPAGTNGGMTLNGTLAAAGGGVLIGVVFYVCGLFTVGDSMGSPSEARFVFVGMLAGLIGSALDSLLGATLQYSGFDSVQQKVVETPSPTTQRISGTAVLDNHGVNFVSAVLTSLLTGTLCRILM